MKTDITMHSENELSLIVFNDEYLYTRRHSKFLVHTLKDLYKFTDEQMNVLINDLKEEG
jgi:hypothetical protein